MNKQISLCRTASHISRLSFRSNFRVVKSLFVPFTRSYSRDDEKYWQEFQKEETDRKKKLRWATWSGVALTAIVTYIMFKSDISEARILRTALTTYNILLKYRNKQRENEKNWEQQDMDALHEECATLLLNQFMENGGVFIKVGQTIASLNHLLPEPYIRIFQKCQDKVTHQDYKRIEAVFNDDFGVTPQEVFEEFHITPFASASLAQVHKAKLKSGEWVAVKIQYNGMDERFINDMNSISLFYSTIQWYLKSYVKVDIDLRWLQREFTESISVELNFKQEAKNCEQFEKNFHDNPNVSCPKIHWNLTSRRVITMELIDGVKINDKEGLKKMGVDPNQVSKILTETYGKQIFLDGFVHCDPHPGNILVRKRANEPVQLVFLDHGLYRQLDPVLRLHYASLFNSIVKLDLLNVKYYTTKFITEGSGKEIDIDTIDNKMLASMITSRAWNDKVNQYGLPEVMTEQESIFLKSYVSENYEKMVNILSNFSSDLLLLLKTDELLRSVMTTPDYFARFGLYAREALNSHRLDIAKANGASWIQQLWIRYKNTRDMFNLWLLMAWGRVVYQIRGTKSFT